MKINNVQKRVLILCEDSKSSLIYFEEFKKDEQLKRLLTAVYIEHPEDYSPSGLVAEAIRRKDIANRDRNKFDEIWIVLDRNGHANIKEAVNLAYQKKIKVAISIICFEVWILLHFERTSKPYEKCDEVISYIKKKYFSNYDKCSSCFDELKPKLPTAIKFAKWLEEQNQNALDRGDHICELSSYTNVHHLVEKLLNPNLFGKDQ
ncbi:MAG: RloB protein [Ignavibacteria bacterium]|nr:RloB protein [Ignavibacteria bacterium]